MLNGLRVWGRLSLLLQLLHFIVLDLITFLPQNLPLVFFAQLEDLIYLQIR